MRAPCQNCEQRQLKCHDSCEKYQMFKVERQTILNNRRKFNESWPLGHNKKAKSLLRG